MSRFALPNPCLVQPCPSPDRKRREEARRIAGLLVAAISKGNILFFLVGERPKRKPRSQMREFLATISTSIKHPCNFSFDSDATGPEVASCAKLFWHSMYAWNFRALRWAMSFSLDRSWFNRLGICMCSFRSWEPRICRQIVSDSDLWSPPKNWSFNCIDGPPWSLTALSMFVSEAFYPVLTPANTMQFARRSILQDRSKINFHS